MDLWIFWQSVQPNIVNTLHVLFHLVHLVAFAQCDKHFALCLERVVSVNILCLSASFLPARRCDKPAGLSSRAHWQT